MGLLKRVRNVRKVAKKVAKPITRLVQKATNAGPLKTVKVTLRKAAAVTAPLTTGGLGLVVQPKVLGIKNASSKKLFDRSQQISRIAVAAAGAVVAAPVVGPAISSAASAAGAGLSAAGGAVKSGVALLPSLKELKSDWSRRAKVGGTASEAWALDEARATAKASRPMGGEVAAFSGGSAWILPVVAAVGLVLMVRK